MTSPALRVLTYHRVVDPAGPGLPRPDGVSATPAVFGQQMRHLARRYRVVSVEEVLAALRDSRPLPPRAVLVTFDDAYRDVGEIAWPILRRYRLPATIFVPTAFPGDAGREFWWDRLHRVISATRHTACWTPTLGRRPLDTPAARTATLRMLDAHLKSIPHSEAMAAVDHVCELLGDCGAASARVLDWHELRELARDGATLAPHTRTHPALTRLPVEMAREEIRGSREDLRRETGQQTPVFAYPFGAHDDQVVQLVREEGLELAVTCVDGHNRLQGTDPLRLRRTNISTRTSAWIFRARLSPAVAMIDLWRHRRERRRVLAGSPSGA